MRIVTFTDASGKEYAGLDRVVGLMAVEPFVIHGGWPGFLGPEIIPPQVMVVTHRQVISRAREEKRKGKTT